MADITNNGGRLVAIIGASAAAMLIALTSGSEGVSLTPYKDRVAATHPDTVCYGETGVEMRAYSLAECKLMLAQSLAERAAVLQKTVPGFDTLTPGQKSAAIDYAYNRGLGAWGRAWRPGDPGPKGVTVRDLYNRRQFPAACDLIGEWGVLLKGKQYVDCSIRANNCYGIYTRRQKEKAMCKGEKWRQE